MRRCWALLVVLVVLATAAAADLDVAATFAGDQDDAQFGEDIALEGDTLVVGQPRKTVASLRQGVMHVFDIR